MPNSTKKWYKKKAVWASIITVLSLLGAAVGYNITPEQQQALAVAIPTAIASVSSVVALLVDALGKDDD